MYLLCLFVFANLAFWTFSWFFQCAGAPAQGPCRHTDFFHGRPPFRWIFYESHGLPKAFMIFLGSCAGVPPHDPSTRPACLWISSDSHDFPKVFKVLFEASVTGPVFISAIVFLLRKQMGDSNSTTVSYF